MRVIPRQNDIRSGLLSVALHPLETTAARHARDGARVWLAAAILCGVGVLAYHNTFSVPFLFDDLPAIVENPAVRQFSWRSALGGGEAGGLTTSGRPLAMASLALNHALSGKAVASYHAVNLLIHLCAGLCLLGVARRTFLTPSLRVRFGPAALPLALGVAALWMLHPLLTESVTYLVQRTEALAGLFGLLTLYAFIRSAASAYPARWCAAAAVACLCGGLSKETAVAIPVVVLLYDRAFVSETFAGAWRRHRWFYLSLGATWVVLGCLVAATGSRGGTAGFGTGVSAWSYALTQCRALVRYLELSSWPGALVFDYGLGLERHLGDVLPQAIVIVALVISVAVALRRHPPLGFAGGAFLALLAPSSSFFPVVTQTMAEHRMYLPLAVLSAGAVLALYRVLGFRAWPSLAAAGLALATLTALRNRDYRSDAAIWRDTAAKLPGNARAHNNLGQALFREGQIDASILSYEQALRLRPDYPESHYNLGVAQARLNQWPLAITHYEAALRLQPGYPEAHNNLANALVQIGRGAEAIGHYERALVVRPDFAEAHNNLGNALLSLGRAREAEPHFQRALALKPDYAEARYNLGNAHAAKGAMREALAEYEQALKLKSNYAEAHVNAGNALLALERPAEAMRHYEQAVTLAPELADAHYNLGSALLDLGRWAEAMPRLESTLRLNPGFVRAHRALGFALAQSGRVAEALSHYQRYVEAVPGDTEAREEMRQLRARR